MTDGAEAVVRSLTSPATGVHVVGTCRLADELRRRLPSGGDRSPSLVIVTSADPDDIRSAFAIVADLGTVALAVADAPAEVEVDVYGDLHVRGLTVVGIDPTTLS